MKKNILVFKYRALGDAILGLSSVSYLKKLLPEAKVTYGVPHWVAPLFQNIETDADEILGLNFSNAAEWCKAYQIIKAHQFDQVIELNQSGRTRKFFSIIKMLSSTSYLAHNHHKNEGIILDQGKKKPNIQRDLDACWTCFKQGEVPSYLDYPPKMILKKRATPAKSIVLGVVATRDSKMWPFSHFKTLMQELIKAYGEDLEFLIPLSGNNQDRLVEHELKKEGLPPQAKIIRVPLRDLPYELSRAKIYIGNDTGLKHICAAIGLKTYTIFGVEDPYEWHPYGKEHSFFRAKVPDDAFKNPDEYKHLISEVTPEKIIEELSF